VKNPDARGDEDHGMVKSSRSLAGADIGDDEVVGGH
jgi:hypothetical protein